MSRLLAIALVLSGCSASRPSTASGSYCTPPECSVADVLLSAAITPANTAPSDSNPLGVARLDVAQLVLDENGYFQIQLAPPVLLTGQVSVGKAGVPAGIAGSVVANRPSRIGGRPDETYQTQLDVKTGQYTLPVTETLPGETYTLRVIPSDTSQYPPQTFQVSAEVVPGAPRQVGFDLVLDDPLTLTQIQGVITDPVGKPIHDLQVQAVDPTSKEVKSTTTVTDASGNYAIRLSKSVQRLSPAMVLLTATPTMTASTGTPMLELTVDVSKTGTANTVTANLQAPPLPSTAPFSYRVSGTGRSGAEEPIVGAQVSFLSLVSDSTSSNVTAVFQAQGQSDSDGVVTLELVPGVGQSNRMYEVSVSPPASSDFEALTLPIAVGPTPTGGWSNIDLQVRPRLSGRVVDQTAQPVASVTVQPGLATVQSALDAKSLADVSNLASTATASDGRFTLAVDSGQYDVGLLPLATMKLPRRWIDRLLVQSDLDVGDILLPPAALVRGQVLGPDGQPLPNADVQIYAVSSSTQLCPNRNLDCISPARLAAEATTGSDGGVQVLLPAATAGLPGAL